MNFGVRLLGLLQDRDMSQKDLAKLLNVTPSVVSKYINYNRIPPGEILIDIAKSLNTSTDYLLGLDSCYCSKLTKHELNMVKAFIKAYRKYN